MALHTIDPDLWQSESFAAMSADAKLLYLGLVSIVDDQGRMRFGYSIVVGKLYMYSDPPRTKIEALIDELVKSDFVIFYDIDGREYIQIKDWWTYQVNSRARASRFPAPVDWQDKHGYVYLIHDGELYKIGISIHPGKRLSQIRYENGRECSLLVLIESPDYKSLELELHEKFSSKRIKGEWFDLEPDDIAWITSLATKE